MQLNRLTACCVPNPHVLAQALREGSVRIAKAGSGDAVAYVIAPHCSNADAIKRAIEQRGRWHVAAASLLGAVGGMLLAGIVQLLIK